MYRNIWSKGSVKKKRLKSWPLIKKSISLEHILYFLTSNPCKLWGWCLYVRAQKPPEGCVPCNHLPEVQPAQYGAGGPPKNWRGRHREHIEAARLVARLEILKRMYRVLIKKEVGTNIIESEHIRIAKERVSSPTGHCLIETGPDISWRSYRDRTTEWEATVLERLHTGQEADWDQGQGADQAAEESPEYVQEGDEDFRVGLDGYGHEIVSR